MNLEDSLKAFHTKWGHPQKPRIYIVINRAKKQIISEGHEPLENDIYELVWFLHDEWERLSQTDMIYQASTLELRCIIARRRDLSAEHTKKLDADVAERLIANLHGLISKDA